MNKQELEMLREEIEEQIEKAQKRLPEGYKVIMRADKYVIVDSEGSKVFLPEEIVTPEQDLVKSMVVDHAFRRVRSANDCYETLKLELAKENL